MKIAIVCYPSYGGSGVVATELGIQLAQRGHIIHFISYERPFKLDRFHENIFLHEVEILEYPLFKFPPYSLAVTSKIVEVAKCAGLDLVHAHYAIPHTVSAYLARQMLRDQRLPVVTTLHGTDITLVGTDKQFYDITRFCIEESDAVTTVSDSLRRDTLTTFQVNRDIDTIHNFIDAGEYTRRPNPALRQRYATPDEKVIVHTSNFRPVKRVGDVMEIFRQIAGSVPSRLLLIGDGPEVSTAQHFATEHYLQDRVFFLGKQVRVAELLSTADLLLLPSEKESFGLVALEAMACGVPVIASDTGGIPEVVAHGETGYLAPVGDTESMARLALMVLQDAGLHRRMADASVDRAHRQFNADTLVSQYEAVYRRCLEA